MAVFTIDVRAFEIILRKLFLGGMLLLLAVVIICCCFYLLSGHDRLAQWYLHLNNCFYLSSSWPTTFFTRGIKSDGNMYCVIAIVISLPGGWYLVRKWKNPHLANAATFSIDLYDASFITGILTFAIIAWMKGNAQTLPAYDEVFSADNAASLPPFQCLSYYMLPNNHLLYNLLNDLFFHVAADKVHTGRIISLVAYCLLSGYLFYWLKGLFSNRWLSAVSTLALMLQFQTWGFSFQARGYELYLLCEWASIISLINYLVKDNKSLLHVYTICCIAGYACLPSFLYLHVAQLIFVALYQLVYRKAGIAIWKYQLIIFAGAFLFYLPALCFSGLEAITANKYVAPVHDFKLKPYHAFWDWMWNYLNPYFKHIFSDLYWQNHSFNTFFLCLPLVLLLNRKNKANVLFGLFYLIMWLVFIALSVEMKRVPFERNLIGHYSIALAGIILVIHWFTGMRFPEKKIIARWVLFPACCLLLAVHFKYTDKDLLKDTLYEYDVNGTYTTLDSTVQIIGKGSTAAFSDESFYMRYMCRKNDCISSRCPTGTEDWYIKQRGEGMPAFISHYRLVKSDDPYDIYQRTTPARK
jgi:hypothetical protein